MGMERKQEMPRRRKQENSNMPPSALKRNQKCAAAQTRARKRGIFTKAGWRVQTFSCRISKTRKRFSKMLYSAKLLWYHQPKFGEGAAGMINRSFANEYFYAYAGFAFYDGKAYTCIAAKPG